MDGDGWGGGGLGTRGNEKWKERKHNLYLQKVTARAHTPSRTLLVREWDPIYEHTHVCVYAYKYMRDPSDMLKICIEN